MVSITCKLNLISKYISKLISEPKLFYCSSIFTFKDNWIIETYFLCTLYYIY